MFYVTFWAVFFKFLFHKANSGRVIVVVTLVTCILEFSQLLDFSFLQLIRSSFIGRALIGSSFSISDFPFYFLGALLAWLLLYRHNA